MHISLNGLLTLVTLAGVAIFILIFYFKAKSREVIQYEEKYETLDEVIEGTKQEIVDIVREDTSLTITNSEFDKLYKRKARIDDALKKCVYCIDSAKVIVIDIIADFIERNVSDEAVSNILGLNLEEGGEPSDHVMFEIIMYRYKKRYGKDALGKWIDRNNFIMEKPSPDATDIHDFSYYITVSELQKSYQDENIKLTTQEKREVLATIVYQNYKGLGCVDTIREMNINGLSLGVSGSILEVGNSDNKMRATNSCWLYYEGKEIHLQFVNFGTEDELRRIVQLICRWNSPGALTAKRGGLVNTMYDKSRVLAVRPPASEYWAVFIRKFSLSDVSPEKLIIKPYTTNGETAVQLIKYLMRGEVTCAVTGRQGSGKTTMMSSIIRFIDPRYTIRVLEMAPELYLRELYPTRNILSLQETTTVTPEMEQDWLKKSNGVVSLVGEVATDVVAMNMIQMGMTASKFTVFSHHGNTPKDLILTLRNSLVNAGGFSNMATAEKQVTDVVRVDIHLEATADGKRYISRISEIVQLEEGIPYPEIDENNVELSRAQIEREHAYRDTDRISFTTREILTYDLDTHTYKTNQRFSKLTEDRMKANLGAEMGLQFEYFMLENWGLGRDMEDELIEGFDDDELRKLDVDEKTIVELKKEYEAGRSDYLNNGDNDSLNNLNKTLDKLKNDRLDTLRKQSTEAEHLLKSKVDSIVAESKLAPGQTAETLKKDIEDGIEDMKYNPINNKPTIIVSAQYEESVNLADEFSLGDVSSLFEEF